MMEDSNILKDSDLRESFSFSYYDFDSSLAVLPDDDDDDDDESYIEIAFEPTPTHEEDDELELRISFANSTLPFPPEFSAQSFFAHEHLRSKSLDNLTTEIETETNTSSSSSSTTLNSSIGSSSSSSCSGGDAKTPGSRTPAMKWRSLQFPPVNRLLNMVVSNLKVSSSETGGEDENKRLAIHTSHLDLVQSGKASKVTRAMNGGMMKFLIKFRSIKIRSMLSFLKTHKVNSPQHNTNHEGTPPHNYQNLLKPFQKQRQRQSSNTTKNSFGGGEKSRVLEINLDAIKGVIEAMGMSIGLKGKHTKSCPTSLSSSPIHKVIPSESQANTGENSVQAAIAHCKRSFGQTPDSHL